MPQKKMPTKKTAAKKSAKKKSRAGNATPTKGSRKEAGFRGEVLHSVHDFKVTPSDTRGIHEIWLPNSPRDVAKAVRKSRGQKTLIRSGEQVATQDLEDASGGIVINLKRLSGNRIRGNVLTAQAAAKTDQVAHTLAAQGLVLPLDDGPTSIVSNILSEPTSYLTRSLGTLADRVVALRGVLPDGKPVVIKPTASASCAEQCRATRTIVTEAELKPVSDAGLWMYRITLPYPGFDRFLQLLTGLFKDIDLPSKADLALRAFNGRHRLPLITVSALGTVPGDEPRVTAEVNEVTTRVFEGVDLTDFSERRVGSSVLPALTENGQAAAADATIDTTRLDEVVPAGSDWDAFLARFARAVHEGIAFGTEEEGKLREDVHLDVRLQARRDGGLEMMGYAYTPNVTLGLIPSGFKAAAGARRASVLRDRALAPMFAAVAGPISGFKGPTYSAQNPDYREKAKQYATSSYPAAKMSPYLLAYPTDVDDIAAAIRFATEKDKKIVARSGGHSYSGLSSGGKNTIVLSMDAFSKLVIDGDVATVGPGIPLTYLAQEFKNRGITIPHGECPFVAIGGHAQTGGFGHLLRSFGLAMDQIQSFQIVLATGHLRTVTRPAPGTTPDNDDLFWAVLGGNAGSFGVVTEYTFKCVRDSDHPRSFLYSATQIYKKTLFRRLMKEIQTWTSGVEAGSLPTGRDLCITVESASLLPTPVILIEPVYANLDGTMDPIDGNQVFAPVIAAVESERTLLDRLLPVTRGIRPLSYISDSFVRRWPATTIDGREFRYPYEKRVNCTAKALTDAFVDEFVDLLDDIVRNHSDVKLVFQMFMGGGAYRAQGALQQTSIPHRDITFGFVFDLFYLEGGKPTALALQSSMQNLIDQHFSNGQERRVFWGCFGNTDIGNLQIQDMYYNVPNDYTRLQGIKRTVDSGNVFSSPLTVKP